MKLHRTEIPPMRFIFKLAAVTAFLLCSTAYSAPDSTSTLQIQDVEASAKSDAEVDQILTNRKMRADSGSRSKYSVSVGLGYGGGSLERPLDDARPNIAEGPGTTDFASMGGSISAKYSLRSTHALLAGTGIRWITPLAGRSTPAGYTGEKVDVNNPYGIYQYIYNWLGLQAVVQAQLNYFTASDLIRDGYVSTLGLSQNSAYLIPGSGLTLGAHAYVGVGYFNDDSPRAKANQSDYSFGFSPFVEYQFTDRLNLRTGTNLLILPHMRSSTDPWTFRRQKVTQNIGLGISVARDLFISPGVDFIISDIRSDRSTISLSASLNLF